MSPPKTEMQWKMILNYFSISSTWFGNFHMPPCTCRMVLRGTINLIISTWSQVIFQTALQTSVEHVFQSVVVLAPKQHDDSS